MKCRPNLKFVLSVSFVVAAAALFSVWLITLPRPAFSRNDGQVVEGAGDTEKGRLVFLAGDCASCHASPGQQDRLHLGGGLALASPYGTFRVPNISSDPVDGIGKWRTVDLANALLSGVSPDRRHYYPVFPYGSYTHMTLADVTDLMAYLRTLPAVSGRAPGHELNLLFSIRRFVGLWKFLYLDEKRIESHSARDLFGGIKPATRFAGGRDPQGTGFYPNITAARIGDWTAADIAEVLRSGKTPDHGQVGSSMADVVVNTAALPQIDRDAMAAYVKSIPARPTPRP